MSADRIHRGTREPLTLEVVPPYSLSLTVQVLRRVPTNIVDQWAGGSIAERSKSGRKSTCSACDNSTRLRSR